MLINVLFRKNHEAFGDDIDNEFAICGKYFPTLEFRTFVDENALIIGRFSVLPFYEELENELKLKNSHLINSFKQHKYIADIMNYYEDVKDFTPKTYTEWGNLPEGAYVVKGRTNSRKHQWNTHMFAKNKKELLNVIHRIFDDGFIANQGIVVREYVPLKQIDEGINGLPITNEWRFFFYKEHLLNVGYYWASHPEAKEKAILHNGMVNFATDVACIISENANFFVLDIAEKADGKFMLVEVNDGQMSGLSMCDPDSLYRNFKAILDMENKGEV